MTLRRRKTVRSVADFFQSVAHTQCIHDHAMVLPRNAVIERATGNYSLRTMDQGRTRVNFCGDFVTFETVVIHHVDHNYLNDELVNLVPAHGFCHNQHHFNEMWATQDSKKSLLAPPTRGHRKPHSDETKQKLREAANKLWEKRRAEQTNDS